MRLLVSHVTLIGRNSMQCVTPKDDASYSDIDSDHWTMNRLYTEQSNSTPTSLFTIYYSDYPIHCTATNNDMLKQHTTIVWSNDTLNFIS